MTGVQTCALPISYEALMVEEFKNNKFEKPFFRYDMEISQNDWYTSFLIPTLKVKTDECSVAGKNPEYREYSEMNLRKINYHIRELASVTGIKPGSWVDDLNYLEFRDFIAGETRDYLDSLSMVIRQRGRYVSAQRDSLYNLLEGKIGAEAFQKLRDMDYNESVANVVLNRMNTSKIFDSDRKLIQKADPVFMKPGSGYGRAHFYAPFKRIGKLEIDTLWFNVAAIWLMSGFLSITLYYNALNRFIVFLESLKIPIWRKFGRELLQV